MKYPTGSQEARNDCSAKYCETQRLLVSVFVGAKCIHIVREKYVPSPASTFIMASMVQVCTDYGPPTHTHTHTHIQVSVQLSPNKFTTTTINCKVCHLTLMLLKYKIIKKVQN